MSAGSLLVYTGPMFGGKTTGLIDQVIRVVDQGGSYRLYKPVTDTRDGSEPVIVTHTGRRVPAVWTDVDLAQVGGGVDLVGIDEAQFLAPSAVAVVQKLVRQGVTVVLAGLDLTWQGMPFGPMPTFLSLADRVWKVRATCECGAAATRTHRKGTSGATVLVGGGDQYEPRCLGCFEGGGSLTPRVPS